MMISDNRNLSDTTKPDGIKASSFDFFDYQTTFEIVFIHYEVVFSPDKGNISNLRKRKKLNFIEVD